MIESFGAAIAATAVKVIRDLVHPIRQRLEELVQRRQPQHSRFLHPGLQALPAFGRIADGRVAVTQVSHLFLARQTERLRGKNPAITLCQVRTAANALIDALPLPRRYRNERLERTSRKLLQDQHQNATARRCHTATRRRRIIDLGITLAELPCCIPR